MARKKLAWKRNDENGQDPQTLSCKWPPSSIAVTSEGALLFDLPFF
jgi:hypothetical protein